MEQDAQTDFNLTLEELKIKYYPSIIEKLSLNNGIIYDNINIKIYKGKNENYDIYYGFCEDCKSLSKLRWKDACADGYNDGNNCCMKLVCNDECMAYCSSGHINHYYNYGDSITFECEICKETINPHCTWWGLSIEEYKRRYG